MKVVTVFASKIPAKTIEESLKTKVSTISVDKTQKIACFSLIVILHSESDNDTARTKVSLLAPSDKSLLIYDEEVKIEKINTDYAIGLEDINMPNTEGEGNYYYTVDINGIVTKELLFELKYEVPCSTGTNTNG